MSRIRVVGFTMVCVLAVVIAAGAVLYGSQRAGDARQPTAATSLDTALDVAEVRSRPHIVFRSTATGPTRDQLAVVPLERPNGPRAITEVRCERVYATRAEGLCLPYDALAAPRALVLDAELVPGRQLPISGIPSRTRLSRDSNLAAITTFVEGHSYTENGFSTATTIHDTRTGRSFGNLEDFRVLVNGQRYRSADLNVWGVTFAGGQRFYATVASRGRVWLAEGDLGRRELRTLREGVECPSLSPDGSRVAYKKRFGADVVGWRLHVLDLRTGRDVALAETRNVDDQVEWLDDAQVLYGRGRQRGDDPNTFVGDETDVWVVAADGSGRPRIFVPRAWSPAVVR